MFKLFVCLECSHLIVVDGVGYYVALELRDDEKDLLIKLSAKPVIMTVLGFEQLTFIGCPICKNIKKN